MSEYKLKPTRWYYVIALLIPIFACLGTTLLVYPNVPKLPGALERMGINDLTRIIAPGSADIYFPKAGGYAVYYEYRSVINGVKYVRDKFPSSINCHLRSKATGEDIELASPHAEGDMYTTQYQERVGVLFKSISINQPGVHIFSCQYTDGRTHPQIVLAVGPNIIWEFFNVAAKPVAAIVCGGLVFTVGLVIAMLIAGLVAFKRYQAGKTTATDT